MHQIFSAFDNWLRGEKRREKGEGRKEGRSKWVKRDVRRKKKVEEVVRRREKGEMGRNMYGEEGKRGKENGEGTNMGKKVKERRYIYGEGSKMKN